MYWFMSSSSTSTASVYASFPLPPGTSPSWMPASSLYCCQRSDSMISAAARNRRIAASPLVRRPPLALVWPFFAKTSGGSTSKRPTAVAPTPSAAPLYISERRLIRSCGWWVVSSIGLLLRRSLAVSCEGCPADAFLSSAYGWLFGLRPAEYDGYGQSSHTLRGGDAGHIHQTQVETHLAGCGGRQRAPRSRVR